MQSSQVTKQHIKNLNGLIPDFNQQEELEKRTRLESSDCFKTMKSDATDVKLVEIGEKKKTR